MPEISVIMRVHRGGRFFAEAVESIIAQTFADWELVLVESGSAEGAAGACEVVQREKRIRRCGPVKSGVQAMISGCAAATGRYVAVLDEDDLALPRRLELQRTFLELQPDVGLLASASEAIDAEGRLLGPEPFAARHEEIFAMTAYVHVLRQSAIMFRRTLLERVPYRGLLNVSEDFDFFARAAEVTQLAALPVTLCRYRRHGDNATLLAAVRNAAGSGLVRMLTRRRRSGLPEDYPLWERRFAALVEHETATEASAHLACARIFSRERHDDLAALHQWLALRAGGGWHAAACYFSSAVRGLMRRREARVSLAKAWLKEPVHQLLRSGGMPDRMQF